MGLGCERCGSNQDAGLTNIEPAPDGYVVNLYFDEQGVYDALGRCYYCNHPRR